jgi:hypothetical protein
MKPESIPMPKAEPGQRLGLLTKQQLAEELSMPLQAVQALTRQKKISVIRLGHKTVRYRLEQVLEDLKKLEIKAAH